MPTNVAIGLTSDSQLNNTTESYIIAGVGNRGYTTLDQTILKISPENLDQNYPLDSPRKSYSLPVHDIKGTFCGLEQVSQKLTLAFALVSLRKSLLSISLSI